MHAIRTTSNEDVREPAKKIWSVGEVCEPDKWVDEGSWWAHQRNRRVPNQARASEKQTSGSVSDGFVETRIDGPEQTAFRSSINGIVRTDKPRWGSHLAQEPNLVEEVEDTVGIVGDGGGPVGEYSDHPDLAGEHVQHCHHVRVLRYGVGNGLEAASDNSRTRKN